MIYKIFKGLMNDSIEYDEDEYATFIDNDENIDIRDVRKKYYTIKVWCV